jgi:exopolyphosphatase / guanosine-5'-triphosphate,3'-diphosphate pyrophosphatase
VRRVAAVDCGTNSLRLLVADLPDGDGPLVELTRQLRVVRLGEGVDRTGELAPAALERTRAALAEYAATCRRLGVERTRMVATSATRDARNRSDFTTLARDVLGAEPEVLTGAEEAALSFDGATRGLDGGEGPFLVIDIGGGSTEFVLGARAVQAALSVDVGCVRLTERHLTGDPPSQQQVATAEADVDAALDHVAEAVPVERARLAVGLAGSVTTVAAHALRLPAYLSERTHLARLDAGSVVAACSELLGMRRSERAALPYMHPGRVDVIGAGALVLRRLVERFDLPGLLVSEADILDGVAWSLAGPDPDGRAGRLA